MKKHLLSPIAMALALAACQSTTETNTSQEPVVISQPESSESSNPFLKPYDTAFGVAPFEQIKHEHYMPAFNEAIKQNLAEIDAIVNNPDAPSFENTIVAMEKSGMLLDKVSNVFFALRGANTDDQLQAIAKEISPLLSALSDDIYLNAKLFQRVKAVYQQKSELDLQVNQQTLLENTYKAFVRGGANLSDADKQSFRELNEKLSKLSIQFGENLLAETNNFEMVIDNQADLAGLPRISSQPPQLPQRKGVTKVSGYSHHTAPAKIRF